MPVSNIAVIGLGYVGLPLAVALSRPFAVIGYDTDAVRVKELRDGHDRTGEIQPSVLRAATFDITDNAAAIRSAQTFIITVPTPVDADNRPDLAHVRTACRTIGSISTTPMAWGWSPTKCMTRPIAAGWWHFRPILP